MDNLQLWEKYCSFYRKEFEQQIEYNDYLLKKHLSHWLNTFTAKKICGDKSVKCVDDLPITDYSDYPVLDKVTEVLEVCEKTVPMTAGETLHDYYMRIFEQNVRGLVEGHLPDEPYFCVKTTGTTGKPKYFVHGKNFYETFISSIMALVLIAFSREWGENVLDNNTNALNLIAPPPYISGWALKFWSNFLNFIPPIEVADKIRDMGKKFSIALRMIEKGYKIHMAGGSGTLLYMICKYFSDQEYFLKESYRMSSNWNKKFLILMKLLITKLSSNKRKNLRDIMPLKGVLIGSTDARLYADFFEKEFGVQPLNSYGSTEFGSAMFGRPDRKMDFMPNLKSLYFEFLDSMGEVKKLHELKKGESYELVGTPFYTMLVRYRIGDMFRVIDFYDGMPVFSFEGRVQTIISIYDYFRVTEDIMAKVLVEANFKASDRWVVSKILHPREKLYVLFEKEWPLSEGEVERRIFDALNNIHPEFRDYVRDFRISVPGEAVKVEFLSRGTFTRYAIKQAKKNVPLGQYKPPKIIPPEKFQILEDLRDCSRNA
ncbi:MAG: GH3 auxin-responsive promoter family protein [Nitrososphaeria archaeon]